MFVILVLFAIGALFVTVILRELWMRILAGLATGVLGAIIAIGCYIFGWGYLGDGSFLEGYFRIGGQVTLSKWHVVILEDPKGDVHCIHHAPFPQNLKYIHAKDGKITEEESHFEEMVGDEKNPFLVPAESPVDSLIVK